MGKLRFIVRDDGLVIGKLDPTSTEKLCRRVSEVDLDFQTFDVGESRMTDTNKTYSWNRDVSSLLDDLGEAVLKTTEESVEDSEKLPSRLASVKDRVDAVKTLLDNKKFKEAKEEKDKIAEWLGSKDPDVVTLDSLVFFMAPEDVLFPQD